MPAYNSSHYIEESISSVLNQTHRNIELIVIDDGSADNTWAIINAWSQRDERIIAMRQENRGVSAARNNAISKSTGDFIAFCDSDDVWYTNKLERQLHTIGDAAWSHCDSRYVGLGYEDKTVYRSTYSRLYAGNIFAHLAVENFITTSSLLVKSHVFKHYRGFDKSLVALEDWKLWLEIAKEHDIAFCNEVLLEYRVQPQSTSRNARALLPVHLDILRHTFSDNTLQNNGLKKEATSRAYLIFSYIAEEKNDHLFSFKCAATLLLYKPSANSIKRVIRTAINLLTKKKY
ncbi:glycosyl transferase [Tenacibaculum sp. KUL118]|nr:glycosyl transferase [Tenacibaculum sp. KUL118]